MRLGAPMSVLHVVAPGEVGGLERVVHLLAHGQVSAGDDVHVAAVVDPACPHHPFLTTLASGGVTTHPIVLPGRAYRRERAAITELCRHLRPHVVHTHGYRADVLDAGAARRLGIPTVTTVHGFTGGGWKNRFYERLQRRAYRRVDTGGPGLRPPGDPVIPEGGPPPGGDCGQHAWWGNTAPAV